MSRIALVVAGIVALALGAIFFIIQSAPPSSSPGLPVPLVASPLDGLDPQRITTISITQPEETDRPTATLSRTADAPAAAGWTLDVLSTRWPVNTAKVLDLLRTLDSAATPRDESPAAIAPATPTIVNPLVIEVTQGQQSATLRLSTTPLAGSITVESTNGFIGTAPTSLLELLTNPGPASWRLTTPFPGLDPGAATHLTIDAHEHTIELARLDKRWRVVRPIAARANPVVVEDALTRTSTFRITRFFDDEFPPPPDALAAPALTLTLARDTPGRPNAQSYAPPDRRTLTVGGALPGGEGWYASIDTPDAVVVELVGPPPTWFSTTVRNYLATTATDVAPADVGAVRLTWKDGTARTLERKLDAWAESPGGASADAATIDEALTFLHDEPAEPQESFSETDVRTLLRVELLDFSNAPLDILNVGYNADGELTVRGTNVVWLYGNYRGPALFNLPDFRDVPAEPGTPPPPKRDTDYPSK